MAWGAFSSAATFLLFWILKFGVSLMEHGREPAALANSFGFDPVRWTVDRWTWTYKVNESLHGRGREWESPANPMKLIWQHLICSFQSQRSSGRLIYLRLRFCIQIG